MLEDKIAAAEAQMKARLAETRATFAHAGNKGDRVEAAFRAFLQQYLPRRLSVGHGEVIDQASNRSGQTDVIVANEDHPFTFTPDEPGLFFVEGVCSGGEVKSVLTSRDLTSTIANARKWKRLAIKPGHGTMIRAAPADMDRYYKTPPYFLVAMESELSLETVYQRLDAEGHFGKGVVVCMYAKDDSIRSSAPPLHGQGLANIETVRAARQPGYLARIRRGRIARRGKARMTGSSKVARGTASRSASSTKRAS